MVSPLSDKTKNSIFVFTSNFGKVMKRLIQLSVLLFALSAIVSCMPLERSVSVKKPDNNPDYKVNYLFEHDGCKVYRFYDSWSGSYVYFTTQGEVTSIKNDSTHRRTVTYRNQSDTVRIEKME